MLQEMNAAVLEPKIYQTQQVENELLETAVPLNSDFIGVSGSFLCLLHCLAPQMIALGSIGLGMSSLFASEGWTLFFFFTCLLAVWHSSRKSVFLHVQILLWLAFALFTTGLLVEHLTHSESIISYFGSGGLIYAHLMNFSKQKSYFKFMRSCKINPI